MNSSFALRRALAAAMVLAAVVCMPAQAALKIDTSGVDLKSTAFKRFRDYVDAAANGSPGYGFSATDAATLYQLSPKEKYCTLAIRLVQTQVDDADARIAQGQRPAVAGDSYLEAGPMISDLGLTWEVCRTLISDAQRAQWSTYAEQTIHNIWNPKAAKWGERAFEWTGWSIDNPGNNYYYSFVEATMFWALASNNETWLKFLREKKLPALTAYFGKLVGGGSLEGTGYGAAHMRLFAIYRVWRDSTGEDLANANSHVDDSIRFWVHATMPTLDRFAPIGDQSRVSVPEIYDYHRRLVLEARALSKNEEVRDIASWWLHSISIPEMTSGFNLRPDLLPAGTGGQPPQSRLYEAKGTGHVFARSDWNRDAVWVGFNAGPYVESHAHQDQGGFTLFAGDWLAVTENIWAHSGIQQGTEVHNVLRFERNGTIIRQREPSTSSMKVIPANPQSGEFQATADLSPAYAAGAGVKSWQRSIEFKGRTLTVHDTFATSADTQAIFQINVPVKPVLEGHEERAGKLHIKVLKPEDAVIGSLEFASLDKAEFRSGWRIDVRGSGQEFLVELDAGAP